MIGANLNLLFNDLILSLKALLVGSKKGMIFCLLNDDIRLKLFLLVLPR